MSKEAKIGLLSILVIFALIYGYKFVVGQNIFQKSLTLKTKYADVSQLTESSPVYVNGFKIGAVSRIELNAENVDEMIVTMRLERALNLPKSTLAVQQSEGLVGGKGIALKFDEVCSNNCLQNGDFIEGSSVGLLSTLLGEDDLGSMTEDMATSVKEVLGKLGDENSNAAIDKIFRNLSATMEEMAEFAASTNKMLERSSKNIELTFKNMEAITKNLADNNAQISGLLTNLEGITGDLKKGGLDQTIGNANATLAEAEKAMINLEKTLNQSNDTFTKLNEVLDEVKNGDGSLQQLLRDKDLYDNMSSTADNLSLLLQDLRLNPSRYVNISVFGKKQPYVKPEDDPAKKN